jgi:cobalamin biosynthesis protein CobT
VNRAHDYLNWWESLPQSPEPAAHLKDFYRELDSGEAFRSKASQVLDLWEQRLKKKESREDWMRLLEEVDRRPKGGK